MSWETRSIYTAYLLFTVFAYIVIALLVRDRTGVRDQAYLDHYRGDEARELYGTSYAELLETTHFHLFSYPLFILVQGHIFLMTAWPGRWKVGLVLAAFGGAALYLSAPWIALYGSRDWIWIKSLGRLLLVPPLILFLAVPLYEMWFVKRARG